MAVKPLVAKSRGRVENKRGRHARRGEIIRRWDERRSRIVFDEDRVKSDNADYLVAVLLHHGQWLDHKEMVAILAIQLNDQSKLVEIITRLLRIIELKEMNYEDYLETAEWKQVAKKAKERYDGRCALDDRHPAEHAHHRTYARRGREYPRDVIPLCANCHARHHERAA